MGKNQGETGLFFARGTQRFFNKIRRFSEESPMPAALAFIVIPAEAGIQWQANPAVTTR
jgi:hypothetical protein